MIYRVQVLIVDDDEDDILFLEEAFRSMVNVDAVITKASNGLKAIAILEHEAYTPDLIVLDINMPIMDGIGTLEYLRRNPAYRQTSTFMLSTSSNDADKRRCAELGYMSFYTKPYTPAEYTAIALDMLTKAKMI